MYEGNRIQFIKEPDSPELYHHIYELAQKDYKSRKVRIFARRSVLFIILIMSALGFFFLVFYFAFLHNYMERLNNQLFKYSRNVETLNTEIEKLTATGQGYLNTIKGYEDKLRNLKIEDNRIVDFDLSDTIRSNIAEIDAYEGKYENIYRGNTGFRETAITFDLGTGEELPYIYSVLKRFNVRATIFISNEMPSTEYGALFRQKNLAYLIKLNQLGCEFGNHTWSHYNLKSSLYETSKKRRLDLLFISDEVLDEINLKLEFDRVKDKLYRETGITLAPFWRAPYGAIDSRILTIASKSGYPSHVFWSSNKKGPLDFYDYITKRYIRVKNIKTGKYTRVKNPYYFSSTETLTRLKEWERADINGLNGAILIGHLGTSRKTDKIINILPEYISYFQNKGYHFVLISELINNKKDY